MADMKEKKLLISSAITVLAISLSFCKNIKLKTTENELHNAKWKVVNIQYKIVDKGINVSSYDYPGSAMDYMSFSNNNKIYRFINGSKDVISYMLIPGNKILCDGDTMFIK